MTDGFRTLSLFLGLALIGSASFPASEHAFVGSKNCRKCHLKQHRSWAKTKMAQAFESSQNTNLDRLFEDIRLVLTEEQMEAWPSYEIRAFRRRTLPMVNGQGMTVSGAGTDLIGLYEEHIEDEIEDAEVQENVQNILASYEREMNSALKNFMEVRKDTTERSLAIGTDWMNNMGTIDEIITDLVGACVKIRDINDRYNGRIAAALASDASRTA